MAQKTNLNVSPYYDDFDKFNNFYKVLFKPGFPIQARELTTLQSILQNQIESFGKKNFSEGQKVIPGNFALNNQYSSVKINSSHLGINLSSYVDQLVGKKIKGQTSGVIAEVDSYLNISESQGVTALTLFVQYTQSGSDNTTTTFTDGEVLTTEEGFTYSNVVVSAGESIATLTDIDATSIGSKFSIEDGVYFIRGSFVDVAEDFIVLDPYTNTPSYRIGLSIDEEISSAKDDSSLFDNAKGFSNFSAPGADRLKITTKLSKKSLDDFNDSSFVEIAKVVDGEIISDSTTPNVFDTKLTDKLAKRTYEESGHYSVKDFNIEIKETLNDQVGNQGIYSSGQTTESGNTPTDDLMSVKFSPGIAYVKGYRIENEETTIIDVDKPRDTDKQENALVPLNMGTLIKVNNVNGTPLIGLAGDATVNLHDRRLDNDAVDGSAVTIGTARVYSFGLDNNSYENDSSEWNLRLYDINLFTALTINTGLTAGATSYIRGKSSGASGYLNAAVTNGTALVLTQVSGSFISGEQIIVNESDETIRTISAVTNRSQQDIKSVSQLTAVSGLAQDFVADTVLVNKQFTQLGSGNVTITTGGAVTSSLQDGFVGAKVGDIIKYSESSNTVPTFNRITAIGAGSASLTVEAVSNVTNVCDGGLPGATYSGSVSLAVAEIKSEGGLYVELPNDNISKVDLKDSQLSATVQIVGKSATDGNITLIDTDLTSSGISSALYKSFTPSKYSFFSETDGNPSVDPGLTLTGGGSGATVNKLVDSAGNSFATNNVTSNVSVLKSDIKSKSKVYTRSQVRDVTLSKTTIGATANGLTQNNFYGLRVQDKEISLNLPDAVRIVGVFESLGSADPTLDTLQVLTSASLNSNGIVGERVIGKTSGVVAQVVAFDSASTAQIVALNNKSFSATEVVRFEESEIESTVVQFTKGNYQDITQKYTLDKGSRSEYYDYSRIVRVSDEYIPSHRLKIVFDYYNVLSTDEGDVYTVNSYDAERFKTDIPFINNEIRASDTLDFRPRVSEFTVTTSSPFAPASRTFNNNLNPSLVVTPNEDSVLGYEYYLPRIDRIVLQKDGTFTVLKGVSSLIPTEPEITNKDDLMLLATVELPAYLYNVDDVTITFKDNRRYTMRDIGDIDTRVSTLENLTTLSLLEVDTKTLQVKDANGFDKFKSGFFVDAFNDGTKIDLQESATNCQINIKDQQLEAFTEITSFKPKIATVDPNLDSTLNTIPSSYFQDQNITKVGNSVLLKYEEKSTTIKQTLASKGVNVNPYNFLNYNGTMILTPSVDTFKEVKITQAKTVSKSGGQTKTYTKQKVLDTVDAVFMRSRNVKFEANNLFPFQEHFSFFDGDSDIDIIPKLLQIEMQNGTFLQGAKVEGTDPTTGDVIFEARIAAPNHKSGPISQVSTTTNGNVTTVEVSSVNLAKTYSVDPYQSDGGIILPSAYSETSTVLNIDIDKLVEEAEGDFKGYLVKDMIINMVGQDTNASAKVLFNGKTGKPKLVSDASGNVTGSFFLRKPKYVFTFTQKKKLSKKQIKKGFAKDEATNVVTIPDITLLGNSNKVVKKKDGVEFVANKDKLFTTGTKTFKITTSSTNAKSTATAGQGGEIYSAEAFYTSTGIMDLVKQTTVKMKKHLDPLAQTFIVSGNDDITCTSIDVWFKSNPSSFVGVNTGTSAGLSTTSVSDDGKPTITLQLVEVTDDAKPSQNLVISDSEVILQDSEVSVSSDASLATNFKFKTPVPLKAGTEYAFVLLAPSTNKYVVWAAFDGETDVSTSNLPDTEAVVVSQPYQGGALFKSQNGSLWTEDQTADLKFQINKAEFVTEPGTVYFHNNQGTTDVEYKLESDSLLTLPRKISVAIASTTLDGTVATTIPVGTKISDGTAATDTNGIVEFVGGGITATGTINDFITITNTGIGYSAGEFTNIELYPIQASGTGAQATVYVSAVGIVTGVTITTAGSGYVVGDLLGITTSQVQKGKGAQITVDEIGGIDTLYLTNVQGEQLNSGSGIVYYTGATPSSAMTTSFTANSQQVGGDLFAGNVVRVAQINHGMHGPGHVVSLKGIQPNTVPETLNSAITSSGETLSVGSTAVFGTFEGTSGTTGYLIVNGEVMHYTSFPATNQIEVTRGVNAKAHAANSKVYKYELNGISLTRINNDEGNEITHNNAIVFANTDIDEYYLAIDRTAPATSFLDSTLGAINAGDTMRSFIDENSVGGTDIKASRNLQFNAIQPNITVSGIGGGVEVSSQIRTVSGRSAGGTETLFVDQGFEDIENNALTQLTNVRTVASRVNEENNTLLTSLPQSRSFTYAMTLSNGGNKNVSPFVDYSSLSIELHRNRLNQPIVDYVFDPRVNLIAGDPHAYLYVTQKVDLQQPATSLKVLIDAYRHNSADFRVLYQLFKVESSNNVETYELFPGFENLKDTDGDGFGDLVVDVTKNNGKADAILPASLDGEFYEYQFTANNLSKFNGFRVKIVASGTNEAYPPIFKNLKVLALA